MSNIKITTSPYKNYGNCAVITNGLIETYVTTELGPRIIKLNLIGKENLMQDDEKREMVTDVSSLFGEGKKFYNYGGHRLWITPEHMPKTYYPDNDPVDVKIDGDTVIFTPPPQAVNNLQLYMYVTMSENEPRVEVTYKATNLNPQEITAGLWAISVLATGGTVICPQPEDDYEGLLPNRAMILWPYTKLTDSRLRLFDKYIVVRQDKDRPERFKIGINNTQGWLAYQNFGQVLKKTYTPNHQNGNYPDLGCSSEIFTNNHIIEAEVLSEFHTLKNGEFMTLTECFELSEAPDIGGIDCQDRVEEYVDRYLG